MSRFSWDGEALRPKTRYGGCRLPDLANVLYQFPAPEYSDARKAVMLQNPMDSSAERCEKNSCELPVWGHGAARQPGRVLASADGANRHLSDLVDAVLGRCEVCLPIAKAPTFRLLGPPLRPFSTTSFRLICCFWATASPCARRMRTRGIPFRSGFARRISWKFGAPVRDPGSRFLVGLGPF